MAPYPECYIFHLSNNPRFHSTNNIYGECLINLLKSTNDDWLRPWKTGVNLWIIVSSVPPKNSNYYYYYYYY